MIIEANEALLIWIWTDWIKMAGKNVAVYLITLEVRCGCKSWPTLLSAVESGVVWF